ncbi:MAG: RyR domain-containing protein [Methylococcales bacterium]|nr:RyR domain-containing protein [Methylococcales bacterium]
MSAYLPQPIDTSAVSLSPDILQLTEQLAENAHNQWAQQRLQSGWRYGVTRDDAHKTHPCLISYDQLPESEKDYDRNTAMESLKAIVALGYRIIKEPSV